LQSQVNTLLQLPFHHLKVADLKDILKTLGLKRSGNKETLIDNLKLYLRKIGQSSDINSLTEVAGLLDRCLPRKSSISHSFGNNKNNKNSNINELNFSKESKIPDEKRFKEVNFVITPFVKPIDTIYCDIVPYCLSLKFSLTEEQTNLFHHNSNKYKILLYCATQISAKDSFQKRKDCPIQYPCNPVLKVNDVDVSGMEDNIRKNNKSWTTKPVDITTYCKKKSNMINEIRFMSTFISSKWKEFVVKIIICEYLSLQEAVNNIKKHFVSKEDLLRQRLELKKSSDDEIETTSSIVSLRCPISKTRIKIPCRFKECTHVQCFDVSSYLQLNEKSPNWKCPVCNIRYYWKSLVIDGYMQNILNNVSSDVDSVTVEVNGTWHIEKFQSHLDKNLHYESEEDEEENRFLAKLEAEIKGENSSVIDLTLSDDENKNSKSSNSISYTISSSLPSLSPPSKIESQTSSELDQLNSHSSRKRSLGDLIAPHRKKANGKSENLKFENTESSNHDNNTNIMTSSSYFNPITNTNDISNSNPTSLSFYNSLISTTTDNSNYGFDLSTSQPLFTDINYSLSKSSKPMNVDSATSLNDVVVISESNNSNQLTTIRNKNTLPSKSLNIPANTNTLLDSLTLPDSSFNTLESTLSGSSTLPSLSLTSLDSTTTSGGSTTTNLAFNNKNTNSLDIFNSNLLSGNLGISQNSLTTPSSVPPTTTKSSSITISMSSSTITSPTLNMNTLNPNPLLSIQNDSYNSLLKSVLLNQYSKVSASTYSPSINKLSLKRKSRSLTNSPNMSPKHIHTSLSAQSSPNLGHTPNKFKNISPRPPKPKTSSFDLTNYYKMLSSMNYSNSLTSTTPTSMNLTNPSLSLTNSLLPLNNTTDPTTLLYYNSLANNNSLFNSNLSQLATPPSIPNYFDPSLLANFQSNPYSTGLFGNNYALSMASALTAASTTPGSNTTIKKVMNSVNKELPLINAKTSNITALTNTGTSTNKNSNTNSKTTMTSSSTAKALEKLLNEVSQSSDLITNPSTLIKTDNKTSPVTSVDTFSLDSNNINSNLSTALLNGSLLNSSSSIGNPSATNLLNSLNSKTTSTTDVSTLALLNSLNTGTTALNPNLPSTIPITLNEISTSTSTSTSVSTSLADALVTTSTLMLSSEKDATNLSNLKMLQASINPLLGLNYNNLIQTNNNLATTVNPLLNSLVSSSGITSITNTNSISSTTNNSNKSKNDN
jgi:hypothetical protein